MTLNTYRAGSLTSSRFAVDCGPGASWRSAFSSRRTPHELLAEPNSTDTPRLLAGLAGQVLEHFLRGRGLIHQQLFEQLVVMVGELFEHVGARLDLAILELGRDFDPLRFLAGAVFERALQGQIDEAA